MDLKNQLHHLCLAYADQRIATAQDAITAAREAAAADEKSSAGDKYETTREMMQQEITRNQLQLAEARKLKLVLERMPPSKPQAAVQAGSLIFTGNGNFYLSVGAGQFTIGGVIFHAISLSSPIGTSLMTKTAGDTAEVNGRVFKILEIW